MKKISKIKAVAALIVLSIAVAIPVAMAQNTEEGQKSERRMWRKGGHRGGDRMGGRLFSQLDLTDAQKAQLKQLRQSHRETLRPLMTEIRTKRQEIRQAHQGGTVDEALIRQKLAEIAPLEAKLIAERARLHQEMLAVLTPEQRTKLDQLREQFKSRRTERRARNQQQTL